MKFEGEKPKVYDLVEVTENDTARIRKWNQYDDMSHVIGERINDNGTLPPDKIFVGLIGNVVDVDQSFVDKNPLFTAKVDQQGRISILKRYRDKVGIKTGDLVDVFHIKKVE